MDGVQNPMTRRKLLSLAAFTGIAVQSAHAAPILGVGGRFSGKHHTAPNSWIEIDLAAFEQNIRNAKEMLTGNAKLCAVMKADAYGLGIEALMPTLLKVGISHIGIASNEEARLVRAYGFRGHVLRVRTGTIEEVQDALDYRVEELIGNRRLAHEIADIGRAHGRTIPIHFALNSGGMSRNGLELSSLAGRQDAIAIINTPNLRTIGIMTHFAHQEAGSVVEGLAAFDKDVAWLLANSNLKRTDVLLHAASTRSALAVPNSHLDLARLGALLYGYPGTIPGYPGVLSFKTRVASVNNYPAGNTVSYDATYTLTRDSLLANIPAGYSDGYLAAFSNKGSVLIRGKRAPVLGKVTMNTMMVDVTDIPGVQDDDEVVLFGRQGQDEITTEETEKIAGVILLDLITQWGNSNPKLVKQHGPSGLIPTFGAPA